MLRRLVALVAGVAVAGGLAFGIDQVVALRFGLAVGVGLGTATFLVVDGSAGSGEGWVYHQVRPWQLRLIDWLVVALVATGIGLGLAGAGVVAELGELGTGIMVSVGAIVAGNLVFLRRRPDYEAALEDDAGE